MSVCVRDDSPHLFDDDSIVVFPLITLTSARACGAHVFFLFISKRKDKKWGPFYSFKSNKQYVFRLPCIPPPLSLTSKFNSITSPLVFLILPPLPFPPSSLCHFIVLSGPPCLGWEERNPGRRGGY